jgi:hypothetical protein
MNDPGGVLSKLQCIHQLWLELGGVRLRSPEFEELMIRIRLLSAEYQEIVDAPQKARDSKTSRD